MPQEIGASASAAHVSSNNGFLGHLYEFDHVQSDWTIFCARMEQYFIANAVKEENIKRAVLLNALSQETYKLVRNLCVPEFPETKTFGQLLKIMTEHFSPVKSFFAERYKFYSARKLGVESVNDWAARLKSLAANCGFGTELKIVLRDMFVIGMGSGPILDRIMEEDASSQATTFEKVLQVAKCRESTQKEKVLVQTEVKKELQDVNRMHSSKRGGFKQSGKGPRCSRSEYSCTVCGRKNHTTVQCRYRNCVCHKCGKKGHLAPVCKFKRVSEHHLLNDNISENDSLMSEVNDNLNDIKLESNCDLFYCKISNVNYVNLSDEIDDFNLNILFDSNEETAETNCIVEANSSSMYTHRNFYTQKVVDTPVRISLNVDNRVILFEVDSGFAHSAISEKFYNSNFKNSPLLKNDLVLKDYIGHTFEPLGKIFLPVTYKSKQCLLEVYVIKNGGPPLIGRIGLQMLGLGISEIHAVVQAPEVKTLCNKYAKLFENELGTFTNYKVSLKLKKDVVPKFYKPRPLPFALKDKVEKELEKLVKLGILKPTQCSEWGTPIVPVLKNNGSIRICGDYKITLNPNLEQTIIHPLPRIEYLFAELQGGQHFSKIDLSQAYQQILVTPETEKLLTISTHKGLFSYTRLPFGISSAPAIFQKVIENLLAGIPGVVAFIDDILITGRTTLEHLERLECVFKKLSDSGLRVAKEKCHFFKEKIEYLGHIIDRNGLHKSKENVEAILKAPAPTNITEIKSFIGMVNFYSKFIPQFSTILSPIYDLLKKNAKFVWSKRCQVAFDMIKKCMVSDNVLVHFDPKKPIKLTADASSSGIGGTICHVFPDKSERPIAFASRRLTDAEKSYSQIQKEALAIVFTVQKFNQYLFAKQFVIVSDSKPLISIFGPKKGIPIVAANRLQRWAHFLSSYNFTIEYVRSDKNHTDFLSRAAINYIQGDHNKQDLYNSISYFNYVADNLPLNYKDIKLESQKDPVLSKVIFYLQNGWPDIKNNKDFLPFYLKRCELSIEQGVLMWGYKIIIPNKFRGRLLTEMHSSHMGIVRMKSFARSFVWWPTINDDIERKVSSCASCNKYRISPEKAKLIPWPWIDKPWTRLHIDFFGPLFSQYFFVIIDSTTKWVECFQMSNISTELTIKKLRETFARFGIPKIIVSDNGTQFTSNTFQEYLKANGILHKTSAPYHPSTNGAAENMVKTIKYSLLKSIHENKSVDLHLILNRFLFMYRNTEHAQTGQSPAKMLLGRNVRSKFDLIKPNNDHVIHNKLKQSENYKGNRQQEFQIGDHVLVRDFKGGKPSWCPATVSQVLGQRFYEVKLNSNNATEKRHLNQMLKAKREDTSSGMIPRSKVDFNVNHNNDLNIYDNNELNVDHNVNHNQVENDNISFRDRLRRRSIIKPPERLQY